MALEWIRDERLMGVDPRLARLSMNAHLAELLDEHSNVVVLGEEGMPSQVECHPVQIEAPTQATRLFLALDEDRISPRREMEGCAQTGRARSDNDDWD